MTGSLAWRLAEWTGRVLLLSAVAFWWGVIVVPRLFSLAFPALLHPSAFSAQLNPDFEGSRVNVVSAVALLTVGSLAFVNALLSLVRFGKLMAGRLRTQDAVRGWIAAGGWTALAATLAYLAWEEIYEFKAAEGMFALGELVLGAAYRRTLWPVLFSPLIIAFVVAMWFFVRKGLSAWAVRAPLIIGFAAWLLAIAHEVSYPYLFDGRAEILGIVLEETLEFAGTLLIGLSAGIALGSEAVSRPPRGAFRGRRLFLPLLGSIAAVAVLGGLAIALLFRAPVVNARALSPVGAFYVSLWDKHAILQELGVLATPPARLGLRITNRDPQGRPGILIWRLMSLDPSTGSANSRQAGSGTGMAGRGDASTSSAVEPLILREGRIEVAAGGYPRWENIDFPPLVEAPSLSKGRLLALQLAAEVEPEAHLRIGATKTNRYEGGRLWINGALAWPGQNLEFAVYSAPELTRSKLGAMSDVFTSDWRWPVLLVDLAVALTLIVFIPALLVTAALPLRGLR